VAITTDLSPSEADPMAGNNAIKSKDRIMYIYLTGNCMYESIIPHLRPIDRPKADTANDIIRRDLPP
jgi:hypothetical protein